ncbi:hypothetical protein CON22_24785 [Bacillus cereus]|nr:hypothetical protein CON22_24785 [Bacillus cereus]
MEKEIKINEIQVNGEKQPRLPIGGLLCPGVACGGSCGGAGCGGGAGGAGCAGGAGGGLCGFGC